MRRSNKDTRDELFVTHCPFRHCLIRHQESMSPSGLTGQMKQSFAEEERKVNPIDHVTTTQLQILASFRLTLSIHVELWGVSVINIKPNHWNSFYFPIANRIVSTTSISSGSVSFMVNGDLGSGAAHLPSVLAAYLDWMNQLFIQINLIKDSITILSYPAIITRGGIISLRGPH